MRATTRKEGGYVLLAAVLAMAAFSLIALEVLAGARGWDAEAAAEIQHARLDAAAQAGVAAAVHGLGAEFAADRWGIDGRPRRMDFNGVSLTIYVEDERGKIPINELNEDQVRTLFSAAGVDGDRLDTLVDSFEDWTSADEQVSPHGAGAAYYQPYGIKPRNGKLATVDELIHIRGMDEALFSRIAPSLTVNFGQSGGFSPETAQPFAIKVMVGNGEDTPEVIEREREAEGERTAIDETADESLIGRTLTIRVVATDGAHGRLERSQIVELTGDPVQPYWIRTLN